MARFELAVDKTRPVLFYKNLFVLLLFKLFYSLFAHTIVLGVLSFDYW